MRNERRIEIGLLGYDAAWHLLLDQIGVPWSTVEDLASISHYSLIIVNRPIDSREREVLDSYLGTIGSLLFTIAELNEVKRRAGQKRYLSSLLPQARNAYTFNDIFDLYCDTYLFDDDSLVATRAVENGICSYLGVDIVRLINDQRSKRKNFYSQTGKFPNECVARVSKHALFQFILTHLEYLHHQRDLPFVHKWFFPNNNRTIFTFRIDSDKGNQNQIEEIYRLGEKHSIPISWFLDVKSHEPWLEYFKKFGAQEIGVHCYEHTIYKSPAMNKENFGKAKSALEKMNIDAQGITSPTGEWNNSIGTIFQQLNFSYSSEFTYDYDNVPSFPLIGSSISTVMQLPVHPVCIGTMVREKMSSEEMIGYYKTFVDSRIQLREPICLYHHPTHGHNEVFDEVFQYINSQNILNLSYTKYSEWWKRRNGYTMSALLEKGRLRVFGTRANDVWLRISTPSGGELLTPPATDIPLHESQLSHVSHEYQVPADLARIRKFTMKHCIQNALDWWIKVTE